MAYPFTLAPDTGPNLGLIVLQSDETIEQDMRRLLPADQPLYISRVPSGLEATPDTLRAMADHITAATTLLPRGLAFSSIGYACTSGTSQIGVDRVATLVHDGAETAEVTNPVTALLAACAHLKITRLGLLTPYVASVSTALRDTLTDNSITTPAFGSFDEALEATVVRIDTASIVAAAKDIAAQTQIDALFLSCTNLRTLDAIPMLEQALGIPILSSNLVLAWHLTHQAGTQMAPYTCRLMA